MLTPEIIKLYQFINNYTYTIFASQAYFDPKTQSLKITQSKFRRIICIINSIILIISVLIFIERFIWILRNQNELQDPMMVILCLIATIVFGIFAIVFVVDVIQAKEFVSSQNLMLRYFRKFNSN